MTIALVRPDADDVLALAALLAPVVDDADDVDDDTVECPCGAVAPDEDTARDELGWTFDADDRLACEDCQSFDGPSHAYDRAYWG